MFTRPTWAEVSLPALRRNYILLRDLLAGGAAEMMPVVKADAYGHGAAECARALAETGARWFAVTCAGEGQALRFAGIEGRILLLSGFFPGEERKLIEQELTPAVWEARHLDALEAAASRYGAGQMFKAISGGRRPRINVHLKVDTGMGRLGVRLEDLSELLKHLGKLKHIELEGVFSHYAAAEVLDSPQARAQEESFEEALKMVRRAGFDPSWVHMANSAGSVRAKSLKFAVGRAMVRPGIALYGYALPMVTEAGNSVPGFTMGSALRFFRTVEETTVSTGQRDAWKETTQAALSLTAEERRIAADEFLQRYRLELVLSWKARVMQIKPVESGRGLGYNSTFVTRRPSKIAALPVGYADGLNRLLSNKGRVIVRDRYAPILGRISMDLTLIDVTDVPGTSVGDEVILIGSSPNCRIDAWEHAYLCGTIPYEILCNISKRVSRVHVKDEARGS